MERIDSSAAKGATAASFVLLIFVKVPRHEFIDAGSGMPVGDAGVLILLAVVQLFLAARHDRAVTAAGPIEELAVYEKRLEEKQRLMDDLEAEVEKRFESGPVVGYLWSKWNVNMSAQVKSLMGIDSDP